MSNQDYASLQNISKYLANFFIGFNSRMVAHFLSTCAQIGFNALPIMPNNMAKPIIGEALHHILENFIVIASEQYISNEHHHHNHAEHYDEDHHDHNFISMNVLVRVGMGITTNALLHKYHNHGHSHQNDVSNHNHHHGLDLKELLITQLVVETAGLIYENYDVFADTISNGASNVYQMGHDYMTYAFSLYNQYTDGEIKAEL